MTDHMVADHLDRRWRRCCQPSRARRIEQRWQASPALAGVDITTLRTRLAQGLDPADNPIVVDLLRAHQAGDDDATTVLLAVLVPFVCYDPIVQITPATINDRWAAAGHLLATVDPDRLDQSGPQPLVRILARRIRRYSGHYRLPAFDITTLDRAVSSAWRSHDAVGEQVIAREALRTIARHVERGGDLEARRWANLVAHHVHGCGTRGSRGRARRTARELALLTGHVA